MNESKSGDSSLRDWFSKSRSSDGTPGWVQLGGKYAGKPCARQPGQTTKPKCGSSKMKRNLDKDEEQAAFRRKNRKDPNPDRKGKAINVKTEETFIEKAGEKDACYKKVKSRYSVWPSAYASGALVKCRKVGAANWGNKSESYEFSNWRDDFKAMEYEFIDIIEAEPLVTEASFEIKHTSADVRKAEKQKKIDTLAQKGSTEGERRAAARKTRTSLPLIQKNHVELEGEQIDELKCWKGYKRKKGAVPGAKGSCVKENEEVIDEARRAKKARNPKPYKEVKKQIDDKEFRAGRLTPAQKHEIEKKENLRSTSSFSRHRMTGSGGHGSDYRVNPRISYIRNQYEIENEIEEGITVRGGLDREAITRRRKQRREREQNKKNKLRPGEMRWIDSNGQWVSNRDPRITSVIKNSFELEVPSGDIKTLVKKAVKRVDTNVSGHVDKKDNTMGDYGEFIPSPDGKKRLVTKVKKEEFSDWRSELELDEAIDKSKMKCNKPKAQAVGDSLTGKSHVVKACEGGKEKIIRFGQRGVKGSPKKEEESKEYASRRHRFKSRHAENIAKGKMSAAYWANKVKW